MSNRVNWCVCVCVCVCVFVRVEEEVWHFSLFFCPPSKRTFGTLFLRNSCFFFFSCERTGVSLAQEVRHERCRVWLCAFFVRCCRHIPSPPPHTHTHPHPHLEEKKTKLRKFKKVRGKNRDWCDSWAVTVWFSLSSCSWNARVVVPTATTQAV